MRRGTTPSSGKGGGVVHAYGSSGARGRERVPRGGRGRVQAQAGRGAGLRALRGRGAEVDVLGEERQDGEQGRHGCAVLDLGQQLVALLSSHGGMMLLIERFVLGLIQRLVFLLVTDGLDKDLDQAVDHQTEPLLFLQHQGLAGDQLARLHGPGQFVKHGSLQVPKDLDGAEEFIEVVGQAGFRVALLHVGEQVELRFFALGFGREPAVHVHEPVSNKPTDGRHHGHHDQQTGGHC